MGVKFKQDVTFCSVTPVLDTNAYGAGDVLFDRTLIPSAARPHGSGFIESIVIVDKDDQTAAAMTLFFLNADVTLGTANAAPSISDANATAIIGTVAVASGDWVDVGGAKVATIRNVNLPFDPVAGLGGLYFAATCAGTPTQTAAGLVFRFAISKN